MLTSRHQVTVEWGDCDPAGIVYFPNYFSYFDSSTNALFLRALGFNKYEMLKKYDIVGVPVVDVTARFIMPSVFGDVVTIESTILEIKRSSFRMRHRLLKGEELNGEIFDRHLHPVDLRIRRDDGTGAGVARVLDGGRGEGSSRSNRWWGEGNVGAGADPSGVGEDRWEIERLS